MLVHCTIVCTIECYSAGLDDVLLCAIVFTTQRGSEKLMQTQRNRGVICTVEAHARGTCNLSCHRIKSHIVFWWPELLWLEIVKVQFEDQTPSTHFPHTGAGGKATPSCLLKVNWSHEQVSRLQTYVSMKGFAIPTPRCRVVASCLADS